VEAKKRLEKWLKAGGQKQTLPEFKVMCDKKYVAYRKICSIVVLLLTSRRLGSNKV